MEGVKSWKLKKKTPLSSAPGEGSLDALGNRRLQRRRRVRPAVLQAHRLCQVGEEGHRAALQTKAGKFARAFRKC